ncbi:PAS domain-containing protein [Alteribacter aurantiacus]|uniref:PAS domain-containing protein n=1 Tax=Alteribacter aurantiacus TaxID=254410 RepID=UPI0004250523|nr:PAS domain-containing protein [Alteribacter aurantiacus]
MGHTITKDLSLEVIIQAMDYTRAGVIITDPDMEDNPIVYANRAFEAISGYEPKEFLGKNCRLLQGPETSTDTIAEMKRAIDLKQQITVTIKNYRKNGETFWNELHIDPVYVEKEAKYYFIGVQKDISEYKESKEKLQSYLEEVSRLSTPIVPIEDGVSVLPLIGNVDEGRLEIILQNITSAVSQSKDHTLILDLSGLTDLNEHVIRGVFNLNDLLRLLGTQLLITGISSRLAIKATQLQIDLSSIRTYATVKEAITHR